MTLRQTQSVFALLVAKLMVWINERGWEITVGDFNRPDNHGHMENSCHYIRLAADLNLFVDGVWKDEDCPEWQEIGKQWKSMHPLCRWGGDFTQVDLNHVSFEWQGRA